GLHGTQTTPQLGAGVLPHIYFGPAAAQKIAGQKNSQWLGGSQRWPYYRLDYVPIGALQIGSQNAPNPGLGVNVPPQIAQPPQAFTSAEPGAHLVGDNAQNSKQCDENEAQRPQPANRPYCARKNLGASRMCQVMKDA